MKRIKRNQLFRHVGSFLESQGIELKEGALSRRIQQGCDLLTEVINSTQHAMGQTRVEVDRKLDQMRQKIHELTAPRAEAPAQKPKPRAGRTAATPGRTAAGKSAPARGGSKRTKA